MGQMHRRLTAVIGKIRAKEVKAAKTKYYRLGGINRIFF